MNETDSLPERSRLVQQHLAEAGLDVQIRFLPDSARTAKEAATAIGCEVGAIANSLVFVADGAPLLVLTSGAHRVDVEVLASSAGVSSLAMAPAALVRETTGQAIGGVAPVGHPSPITTVIDQALQEYDEIWAAAGHPHTVMPLTFSSLRDLTGANVVAVAR